MSQEISHPRPVGFVGSVALPSAAAVFEAVSTYVGPLAKRIPDGETGERLRWIGWQRDQLIGRPGVELALEVEIDGPVRQVFRQLKLKPGFKAADLNLRPLGYLEAARDSFAEFEAARKSGKLAADTRFQISLPTPIALATGISGPRDEVLSAFEAAYRSELADIFQTIPPSRLAIQWDVAIETHGEEARRHPAAVRQWFVAKGKPPEIEIASFSFQESIEALARACAWIPIEAELGIHLCYGDPDGKHLIEPHDMSVMVELVNGLTKLVRRRIDWIHMPVPIERDDNAYFEPMRAMDTRPETTIFLGLVHLSDGIDGARRRISAAKIVLPNFGVATECGLGRRDPAAIPDLLALHKSAAELP
jgi:hypothetical protein